MFSALALLVVMTFLMLATVARIPFLKHIPSVQHPAEVNRKQQPKSHLCIRDSKIRRDFMRLSIGLTLYSLLAWLPNISLSFYIQSRPIWKIDNTLLIPSDVLMCILYISPNIIPFLLIFGIVWTCNHFNHNTKRENCFHVIWNKLQMAKGLFKETAHHKEEENLTW